MLATNGSGFVRRCGSTGLVGGPAFHLFGCHVHDRKVVGHESHAERKYFDKAILTLSQSNMSNDLSVVDMAPFCNKCRLYSSPGLKWPTLLGELVALYNNCSYKIKH